MMTAKVNTLGSTAGTVYGPVSGIETATGTEATFTLLGGSATATVTAGSDLVIKVVNTGTALVSASATIGWRATTP
jgi:hypothetical protein